MSKIIAKKKKKDGPKQGVPFIKKKNKAAKDAELVQGILSRHKKGFGFVTPEEGTEQVPEDGERQDIFIAGKNLNGAMNGDLVSVLLIPKEETNRSREGIIQQILTHGVTEIVGVFEKNKRFGFVVPDDKHFNNEDVFVKKSDWKNAENGDRVVVQITKYPEEGNRAEGRISEIISKKGEPGGDIKGMIRQYNLFQTFPSRVNAEAKAVSRLKEQKEADFTPIAPEELKGRVDLREKNIITIDGPDAKDLDDAVSIEQLPGGNYLLGVHIADVSHYVAEGGAMDKEALKRGTSVYLVDQVIPMLPKALSNGICSLNPDVDRLTLSVSMEIDSTGQVVRHQIFESVIHSAHRMVYDDVSDMLERNAVDLISKYDDIYKDILHMKELADILHKRRDLRGSLDFDFDEAYITLDEAGIPVTVETAERRIANRMIEEFMLIANETVAEHFYWLELPFVYRVHEKPAMDRMDEFKNFVRGFGLTLHGSTENVHPRVLSDMLKEVKGQSYETVVNTVMLRSMKKAFYDVSCDGHFGLGVKFYCHFTSPIRRYPDLIIHRIIKEAIGAGIGEKRNRQLKKKTEEAAELSSKAERHAQELEREVEKLKKTEYMSYHIGESFEGVISGVTNFGFYVELTNTIEGLVRVESLKDDYYDYEQTKYRLIGQRTHKIYTLGDKVRIQVARAEVNDKEIDFIVAEEETKAKKKTGAK
ncbi:ribonuclease R [Aminipila butyrica]|uniref:Ribonuclease R n=1 Tax=Aminipila butyrica TaxID=433296 RepID=A0A858BYK7_9FIRM|nr:ribonuclease R [Aminipila butyrica]QIB69980.1 ribonuclease R [Aminipila butyrica]